MRTPALALRFARRELRGGLRGFRVFLACLTLGVAAITTIGTMSASITAGLRADGRLLLGGDIELQMTHRPASAEQRDHLRNTARVSEVVTMRGMARTAGGSRTLVELKAVDGAYPLFGALDLLTGPVSVEILEPRDGVWGALIDPSLAGRLGIDVGERLRLGEVDYEVRGVIDAEPDRASGAFALGPRFMIALDSLGETGLVQEGSLIRYRYRIGLPAGRSMVGWRADLKSRFPDAGWRLRDYRNASAGLRTFIERMALFMTLVGLTALLVGGVGIANAVKSYLDGRTETIATLKCLGAPSALIFWTYLWQVLILAVGGIAVGLLIGLALPPALLSVLGDQLPVVARFGFYPAPLVQAAAFGVVTAIAFALWPLARAREVPAGRLFRQIVATERRWPRWPFVVATGTALAALAGLAIWTATDRWFAMWFVLGAAATIVAFRGAAWLLASLARSAGRPRDPGLRLALANLYRPGAPTDVVVLSFGLGLAVLVAVTAIEGNLARQLEERIPEAAPAYFFIDIQPDQVAAFDQTVQGVPGVGRLERVPSLRGRITAIKGTPVAIAQKSVAEGARWALSSDRGLTYATEPPNGTEIVAGDWWPADYSGPPLISFDSELAAGMGLGIGDSLTLNILGREIVARIGNLREIDWRTLGINFTFIFAPGTLEAAPHTHIATVHADTNAEELLLRAVTDRFANISAVRIKDALETVGVLLAKIAGAMRATSAVTLLVGVLVLAGAVAGDHRRRVYDAVVLKVLGARRRDILRAYLIEHAFLGLATAVVAVVVGSIAAWAVITLIMRADWVFLPVTTGLTAGIGIVVTTVFGFVGTWRALGHKAAPVLRSD